MDVAGANTLPSIAPNTQPLLWPHRSRGGFIWNRQMGMPAPPISADRRGGSQEPAPAFRDQGRDPGRGWRDMDTVADMHPRTIAALEKSAKKVDHRALHAQNPAPLSANPCVPTTSAGVFFLPAGQASAAA